MNGRTARALRRQRETAKRVDELEALVVKVLGIAQNQQAVEALEERVGHLEDERHSADPGKPARWSTSSGGGWS